MINMAGMYRIQLRLIVFIAQALGLFAIAPSVCPAQEQPDATRPRANFPTATLGGVQFWSDELVFHSYRIQQNVLTGHYRLLDDRDFRMASGTFDECRTRLDQIKREHDLKPVTGRVVITLHGLVRSRDAMDAIGQHLEDERGYTWLNVSYASSRRTLDEHAQSLARVMSGLDEVSEINFVCHSMGNLVVRRYLGEASEPNPRWKPDQRIKRMVMIGPPNNGAQFARFFTNNKLYSLVTGPSGKQLAVTWEEAQTKLAVPQFEFGIIAGGRNDGRGANPLVEGDDDLVVAVEETRLPGARDFLVVPRLHGHLLEDDQVRRCVSTFLREGHFVAADKRQPIEGAASLTSGPRRQ